MSVDPNTAYWPKFSARLADPVRFTRTVDNERQLGMFLASPRGHYEAARPRVLDLLEIARQTVGRAQGLPASQPFDFSGANTDTAQAPLVASYRRLVAAVAQHHAYYSEPDLQVRLKMIVLSILSAQQRKKHTTDIAAGQSFWTESLCAQFAHLAEPLNTGAAKMVAALATTSATRPPAPPARVASPDIEMYDAPPPGSAFKPTPGRRKSTATKRNGNWIPNAGPSGSVKREPETIDLTALDSPEASTAPQPPLPLPGSSKVEIHEEVPKTPVEPETPDRRSTEVEAADSQIQQLEETVAETQPVASSPVAEPKAATGANEQALGEETVPETPVEPSTSSIHAFQPATNIDNVPGAPEEERAMDATPPADANANAMVVDEPEQQVEAMADPPRTPLGTEAAPTPSLSADDAEVEQRLEEDQAVPGTPVGPAPPVQASSDSNAMLVDEPERHAPKPASKIRMPAPLWTFLPLSKGVDQGAGSSTKPSPSSALSADPLPLGSSLSEQTGRCRSASVPPWPRTSAEAAATSETPSAAHESRARSASGPIAGPSRVREGERPRRRLSLWPLLAPPDSDVDWTTTLRDKKLTLESLEDPPEDERPAHGLPLLAALAIQSSSNGRLTVSEIYATIERRFAWYAAHTQDKSWKNSIRHLLSLYSIFVQTPRITENGKGHYWTVDLTAGPGMKRTRKRASKKGKEGAPVGRSRTHSTSTVDEAGTSGRATPALPDEEEPDEEERDELIDELMDDVDEAEHIRRVQDTAPVMDRMQNLSLAASDGEPVSVDTSAPVPQEIEPPGPKKPAVPTPEIYEAASASKAKKAVASERPYSANQPEAQDSRAFSSAPEVATHPSIRPAAEDLLPPAPSSEASPNKRTSSPVVSEGVRLSVMSPNGALPSTLSPPPSLGASIAVNLAASGLFGKQDALSSTLGSDPRSRTSIAGSSKDVPVTGGSLTSAPGASAAAPKSISMLDLPKVARSSVLSSSLTSPPSMGLPPNMFSVDTPKPTAAPAIIRRPSLTINTGTAPLTVPNNPKSPPATTYTTPSGRVVVVPASVSLPSTSDTPSRPAAGPSQSMLVSASASTTLLTPSASTTATLPASALFGPKAKKKKKKQPVLANLGFEDFVATDLQWFEGQRKAAAPVPTTPVAAKPTKEDGETPIAGTPAPGPPPWALRPAVDLDQVMGEAEAPVHTVGAAVPALLVPDSNHAASPMAVDGSSAAGVKPSPNVSTNVTRPSNAVNQTALASAWADDHRQSSQNHADILSAYTIKHADQVARWMRQAEQRLTRHEAFSANYNVNMPVVVYSVFFWVCQLINVRRITQEKLIQNHGLDQDELEELFVLLDDSCSLLKGQIQAEVAQMAKDLREARISKKQTTHRTAAPDSPAPPDAVPSDPVLDGEPKVSDAARDVGRDPPRELDVTEKESLLRMRFSLPQATEVSLDALPSSSPDQRPPHSYNVLCALAIWSTLERASPAKSIVHAITARFPWYARPDAHRKLSNGVSHTLSHMDLFKQDDPRPGRWAPGAVWSIDFHVIQSKISSSGLPLTPSTTTVVSPSSDVLPLLPSAPFSLGDKAALRSSPALNSAVSSPPKQASPDGDTSLAEMPVDATAAEAPPNGRLFLKTSARVSEEIQTEKANPVEISEESPEPGELAESPSVERDDIVHYELMHHPRQVSYPHVAWRPYESAEAPRTPAEGDLRSSLVVESAPPVPPHTTAATDEVEEGEVFDYVETASIASSRPSSPPPPTTVHTEKRRASGSPSSPTATKKARIEADGNEPADMDLSIDDLVDDQPKAREPSPAAQSDDDMDIPGFTRSRASVHGDHKEDAWTDPWSGTIVHVQRGLSHPGHIDVQFTVGPKEMEAIQSWMGRTDRFSCPQGGLCLSIAAYRDLEDIGLLHAPMMAPFINWPSEDQAVIVQLDSEDSVLSLPLAPPLPTHLLGDLRLDLSTALVTGCNDLRIRQSEPLSEYTFVFSLHQPLPPLDPATTMSDLLGSLSTPFAETPLITFDSTKGNLALPWL